MMGRHDWSASVLPPPEHWPPRLSALVDLMLVSPTPTFIGWGPGLGLLYNNAHVPLMGDRHPLVLGCPLAVAWPKLWEEARPIAERVLAGESIHVEFQRITVRTGDNDRDAWFHACYMPIHDGDHGVQGIYCTLQDTTREMLTQQHRISALQRLQQLFEQAPGFMAVTQGPEHRFEIANEACTRLVGERDLVGRTVREVMPDVAGQGYLELLDNAYRSGEAFVGRRMAVHVSRSGNHREDRYVDFVFQPIRGTDGAVTGIFIQGSDVTEQERLEVQLRESEAKFRTITDAMPQIVWSTLPDGFHDYFNRGWYEFTGVPEGTTYGNAWSGLLHPADMGRSWQLWQHSLATGEPYEVEYRLRHRSGEYRWVLGRALPLRDQGNITRWMGTCTDIHERVIAREMLQREAQRKDEFLAMLAHELRNPLAPIRAAASVLPAAAGDAERTAQLADVIERQVAHMTRLVDDLLDVSRVTRGLAKLDLEPDDLKSIVTGAVEQVRPLIEKRRHTLATWMVPAPVPVRADRTRLVQVFANLLNNAAKYTPDGGHIELRVDIHDGEAVVGVRDNGTGIDAQLLPHVFDLFSQGARDADRSQGGLGIGLALARSITQLHGGQIVGLSNGRGQGSEFIVRLPMAKPATDAPATAISTQPAPRGNSGCSVVVVDDNVDAARTIALALEIAGHEVSVCHTATAAFAMAAHGPASVYIIDIGLPDMPGYDLAQQLRRHPGTAHATLIALTGYGRPEDRERSKEAGFDRHLVKPVDVGELTDLMDAISSCPSHAT
ncbi:hypothetical protein ASD14_11670 [Lysobacter sp. Root494]|nr:hypothetical protein ASD14_11670 [Lysobacter sp. Root494]